MSFPTQTKAVRVEEYNKPYQIVHVDVPSVLDPNDLIVKVAVASYCHSDAAVQSGGYKTKLPCIASHEGAGTVVALGSAAEELGFSLGQRVMCGMPLHPCGTCADCLGPLDRRQYCPNLDGFIGLTVDGCFAEYVKADARFTSRIPPQISFVSAAPFACAGRTVWRGVKQTGLRPGQWLAIVGSGGGLGHLGVKFAKALGYRVVGIDARDEGLSLSWEYGATVVVDARKGKEKVVQEVQAATDGEGVDATVWVSDHGEAANIACGVTRRHGVLVQIAQPERVSISFEEIVIRNIQVRGSMIASFAESEDMLDCVIKNGIKVQVTKFHGLEQIFDMLNLVHSGKNKGKALIIIDPQQIEKEEAMAT